MRYSEFPTLVTFVVDNLPSQSLLPKFLILRSAIVYHHVRESRLELTDSFRLYSSEVQNNILTAPHLRLIAVHVRFVLDNVAVVQMFPRKQYYSSSLVTPYLYQPPSASMKTVTFNVQIAKDSVSKILLFSDYLMLFVDLCFLILSGLFFQMQK